MNGIIEFVKDVVKNNQEGVLLQNLREEINKQKKYKHFFMALTDVLEFDNARCFFVSLPEDHQRTIELEEWIVEFVKECNTEKAEKVNK